MEITAQHRADIEARYPDCMRCGAPFYASGRCLGYGWTRDGARHCYACCADTDRAGMIRTGHGVLYLSTAKGCAERDASRYDPNHWKLSNWPGTLQFKLRSCSPYRHPFSHSRRGGISFEFTGPDGARWYGRHDADHQVVTVRRYKSK